MNAATGDGAANEAIVWSDVAAASIDSFQGDANSVDSGGQPIQLVYGLLDPSTGNANQIGITATMSEKVLAGSSLTVTFGTGGTAVLTPDYALDATGRTMSGNYTVRDGDDTASLNITGVAVTTNGNVYDAYGNAMTSPEIPNGENLADNSDIEIDADAPDVTITTIGYNVGSGAFTISGTGFDTINRPSNNDVVGQLDWSKFVWDIDGAGSGGVTFEAADFQSAIVSGNTITALLTPEKKAALEGEAGYGFDDVGGSTTTTNAADNIDITAGFIRDDGLNVATGDAAANEAIVWSDVLRLPLIVSNLLQQTPQYLLFKTVLETRRR